MFRDTIIAVGFLPAAGSVERSVNNGLPQQNRDENFLLGRLPMMYDRAQPREKLNLPAPFRRCCGGAVLRSKCLPSRLSSSATSPRPAPGMNERVRDGPSDDEMRYCSSRQQQRIHLPRISADASQLSRGVTPLPRQISTC